MQVFHSTGSKQNTVKKKKKEKNEGYDMHVYTCMYI